MGEVARRLTGPLMDKAAERVARRYLARAIRVDKGRARELAKELERVLAKKIGGPRPLGKQILVPAAPYDIQTVDGTTIPIYIRLGAVETTKPFYVVDGGYGVSSRYPHPIVVVNVNGSMEAEQLRKAAQAHQVHEQLYPVLIHELTHAADKYSKGVGSRMTVDEMRTDMGSYYNDPTEVRAYMQEVVDEAQSRFQHWDKLKATFGPGKGLEYLLKMCPTWQEVSPHWTDRNKQLVIKAVAQALNDRE